MYLEVAFYTEKWQWTAYFSVMLSFHRVLPSHQQLTLIFGETQAQNSGLYG